VVAIRDRRDDEKMLTRRTLLTTGAAVVGTATTGAMLAACDPDPAPPGPIPAAPPLDPNDWANVRAQFPLRTDRAQFAAFVFASHPATVRAAIDRHRAGLDADPHGYLDEHEADLNAAVATAATRYLDTRAGQVAFTDSTTAGLGTLYSGLQLRPGDEILTTEHDFYSTHESLRLRQVRDGVAVRRVRLYDEPERASAAEMVSRLRAAVTPATRIVAVTWVHSSSGVALPIRAMADALAEVNAGRADADRALLCMDGVHGFGVLDATPDALGCDFLVSGTHKWLFGPRGTGLIWGRPQAWARFTPIVPPFATEQFIGWFEGKPPTTPAGSAATPGGYHSFEHRWALAQAFDLHREIGRDRVAARSRELAGALLQGLSGIRGVRVRTPPDETARAAVVCCQIDGVSPAEAVDRLRDARVNASVTPYATSYLRFGASIVTNESDVEAALKAVRDLS
jgi:selenocysteine lyase/cysteine desulfurase